MNSNLKKGLFLVTLFGVISISGERARAEDVPDRTVMPGVGIEAVLNSCHMSNKEIDVERYLVPTEKGEYFDMAFANVDADTFLFIRSKPTKESAWLGKLYPDYAAKIIGPVGEWTRVQSGTVTGYVCTKYIIIGSQAEEKAQELIRNSQTHDVQEAFHYAKPREEEEAERNGERGAAAQDTAQKETDQNGQTEAAAQNQSGQAAASGQAVVDYACQFIGNPYVWGGTSLTEGADCSGFVQSVFAHFGINLPRTTWDQETVGTAVSYEQAVPGDLILYEGHVGIYMGNGEIVNAINPSKGIGVIPAECMAIKTVRRVL